VNKEAVMTPIKIALIGGPTVRIEVNGARLRLLDRGVATAIEATR
jgi:hypothetical protein